MDERYITSVTAALGSIVDEREAQRKEEEHGRLSALMSQMEEREQTAGEAWERREDDRDSMLANILTEIVKSNQQAAEQTRLAEQNRARQAEQHERDEAARWKQDRDRREHSEYLKSIPPPTPMTKEQDVADYLELFEDSI